VTDAAEQDAERLKDDYVSTEHLFVAIASEGRRSRASRVLEQHRITRDAILQALTTVRGSQRATSQNPESTYEALARYGRRSVDGADNHGRDHRRDFVDKALVEEGADEYTATLDEKQQDATTPQLCE
jgi:ATP-dependent Clp protease ATP-binding subunit ClpA